MRAKKVLLAKLYGRSGITKLFQKHSAHGLVMLNYHRLRENGSNTDFCRGVYGPSPELFERHMRWVAVNTDVLSEDDLLDVLNGQRPFPKRGTVVTFDDGYIDNYSLAYPVLKVLNLPAIFFIPTQLIEERNLGWWDILEYMLRRSMKSTINFLGKAVQIGTNEEKVAAVRTVSAYMRTTRNCNPRKVLDELSFETGIDYPDIEVQDRELMTWEQIEEVSMNRVRIGSHTHTHKVLSTLDIGRQSMEMEVSKRVLEDRLKIAVKSIAYPVGGSDTFTEETKEAAKEVGYELGFSFVAGSHRHSIDDAFEIKRISPHSNFEFFKMSLLQPEFFIYR